MQSFVHSLAAKYLWSLYIRVLVYIYAFPSVIGQRSLKSYQSKSRRKTYSLMRFHPSHPNKSAARNPIRPRQGLIPQLEPKGTETHPSHTFFSASINSSTSSCMPPISA